MTAALRPGRAANDVHVATSNHVTVGVAEQDFALPVSAVSEVFVPPPITPVPLAPAAVRGLLNLRGRVVTAIDLRSVLGYPPAVGLAEEIAIGFELGNDRYAVLVDRVGDVIALADDEIEPGPQHIDPRWRALALGMYRSEAGPAIILDIARLLAADQGSPRSNASSKGLST